MAEDGFRVNQSSSGLALILDGGNLRVSSQRAHLVSYCDDIGHQSVERTLEHILGLPYKSFHLSTSLIDVDFVRSVLKNEILKLHGNLDTVCGNRTGICITDNGGGGPSSVMIDKDSICGNIRIFKPPAVVESLAKFSSARSNACVWKGKWMYEVILETAGIQQLGWAALSCLFTDYIGVGDVEDSYAFDGKRLKKWNRSDKPYGQSWVVGDVIGCCIDLDCDEISFYRNGVLLGVAFDRVRKMGPGLGYFPAISLSQGERCDLNFGARPFKFPVDGFLPIQAPPTQICVITYLLQCLLRLLEVQSINKTDPTSVNKPRKLKRFSPIDGLFHPISRGICRELFSLIDMQPACAEYFAWGPLVSFLLEVFGRRAPHDYASLDRIVDIFLEFPGSHTVFQHVINALSCSCKTAPLVLAECPHSGSYPFLALACHFLRHKELMVLFWSSSDFDFLLEGFLSRKGPNKEDLECLMPYVWWPGSCEDSSSESSMIPTTTALSEAISKIEEVHRELCRLVIQFIPPTTPPQFPGMVFRTFLQNLMLKNRGADRNVPPPNVSGNSVLVSLYTVILYFLSEGFGMGDTFGWMKGLAAKSGIDENFLHRGGQQSFPVSLFLGNDPHRTDISRLGGSFEHLLKSHPVNDGEAEVVQWEEGCMDDEETKVTHSTRQKPCCCSNSDLDFARISKNPIRNVSKGSRGPCIPIPERSTHVAAECSTGTLNDEIEYKPSSSDQSESDFGYHTLQTLRCLPSESNSTSASLREEELLDAMLLLYHLGLVPNFKQASYYMSHQSQSLFLLDETDKQIRERSSGEQLKRLKEARMVYREELIDCVRHSAWYRVSLFSHWKQRGMYATCMWVVQLLLVISKIDSLFLYVPEYYIEALVDSFHALRKSDPPFVSSAIFIKHGLNSFVTFVVTHFTDPRISSAALRDLLLQSIQVLVQYRDYLLAFESNEEAIQRMPRALLSAFDNRSWIPVTNILLRLCRSSGFGSSKHGESSSSTLFQDLIREACVSDECLFPAFLNRLFNTLSWTMTEFSVSIREMQEKCPVLEMQQRKCSVIFDLSCNLARVLEFCTCEIPQAFLSGPGINLQRLTELIIFILNHVMMAGDSEFFDLSYRRQGQSAEKMNRGMILAPLVGIILNLLDASAHKKQEQNDLVEVLASMDCPATVHCGFKYLLDYNWNGVLRVGDASVVRLGQLEKFLGCLRSRTLAAEARESGNSTEEEESYCCICYACEPDARFKPCQHISCYSCITRHLLNSRRCFFCNATVIEVVRINDKECGASNLLGG